MPGSVNRGYRRLFTHATMLASAVSFALLLPFVPLHSQQVGSSFSILTNWTVRQQSGPYTLVDVGFGNGLFVAIGNSGYPVPYTGIILTSTDGIRWTQRFAQSGLYFRQVAFHQGVFVAVSGVHSLGGNMTAILISTNGLNWSNSPIGYSYPLYAVGGGNGKFIISGANYFYQTTLFSSTDGITWNTTFSGQTPWITSIAFGAGAFVLGASPSDQGTNRILRSTDGATWRYADPPVLDQQWRPIRDVIYGRNEFVALEQRYDETNRYIIDVLTSTTGTEWLRTGSLTNRFAEIAVAYGGGLYVVAAEGALHISTDARYWALDSLTPQARVGIGVAYGQNTFVVVGDGGVILQSATAPASVAPVIVIQPESRTSWPGTNLTLTVGATGTPPLGYQWLLYGTNLLNATNSFFVFTNVQPDHAGDYSVVVTSPYGSVTSAVATVEVRPPTPPRILTQPQSTLFAVSSNAALNVIAEGSPPLRYQWRFNGADLAAATNALLVLSNATPADAGNYTVVVANSYGTVTSQVAVLTQWLSPIVRQPQNIIVTRGGTALFTVLVSGDSFTFQWCRNGAAIPDSTNSVLVISNAQYADQADYTVIVGQFGFHVVSDPASLKVLMAPMITEAPKDQGAYDGESVTFTVSALGTLPISYQWQFDGTPLPDATNSVLNLSNVEAATSGAYQVVVGTGNGSITSSVANLTVLRPLQVVNLAASGFGSLEQALLNANASTGGHILLTNLVGTLTNSSRFLLIGRDTTIIGSGAHRLTIAGTRVTVQSNATCRLTDLTFSGTGSSDGPLIRNEGKLHLQRCVVSGAGSGRGVVNSGVLSISDSALVGNHHRTGWYIPFCGIAVGAALLIETGPVFLTNCTFSGNAVEFVCYDPRNPTNVTRSGSGAAIFSQAFQQPLAIVNCTFADNYSPDGSSISAPTTVFHNNIVADSRYGSAASIPPELNGTNLVGTWARTALGPLQLNGGTTPTHALLPGSAAIDSGGSNGAPLFDQRGYARPAGATVDVGAFEFDALPMYTLLVTSAGGGRVQLGPDRPSYTSNSIVILTAVPDIGSTFWRWSGDATGAINPLTISISSNMQVTAHFLSIPLAIAVSGDGRVTAEPMRQYYSLNESVTLTAIPSRWNRFVGWSDGSTNNPRVIAISSNNNYLAVFMSVAPLETLTYGGVSRTAPVGMPAIFVDGKFTTNGAVTNLRSAEIAIATSFAEGNIFYTHVVTQDPPRWKRYTNAFTVRKTFTLRTLAQNADLSTTWEADPVQIVIIPAFLLGPTTPGGGSISVSPANAPYLSNTLVSVVAIPAPGWTFLQWIGDVTGTNRLTSVLMTRDKSVHALFGTPLQINVAGEGVVTIDPLAELYPYGTSASVTATPRYGNYFVAWDGAISGPNGPSRFIVTNANPTISGKFDSLGFGEHAFTARVLGWGEVAASPSGSRFKTGQTITLTAAPDPNQEFIGWGGHITGAQNPTTLSINDDAIVIAHFTSRPQLTARHFFGAAEGIQLTLNGKLGDVYLLERSANLQTWTLLAIVTNTFGVLQYADSPLTDFPQFYRTVQSR